MTKDEIKNKLKAVRITAVVAKLNIDDVIEDLKNGKINKQDALDQLEAASNQLNGLVQKDGAKLAPGTGEEQ